MDDLISRKALDDAFTELRWNEDGTLNHFGDRPDWCMHGSEVDKLIQNAPSVPAVPLDKLCEWLNKNHGELPPCPFDEDCYECGLDGVACIKRRITAWMEGQDAAN